MEKSLLTKKGRKGLLAELYESLNVAEVEKEELEQIQVKLQMIRLAQAEDRFNVTIAKSILGLIAVVLGFILGKFTDINFLL